MSFIRSEEGDGLSVALDGEAPMRWLAEFLNLVGYGG